MASCNCAGLRAEAQGRQTGIGSAESPGPSASDCLFQHGHRGWGTVGCEWGSPWVLLPPSHRPDALQQQEEEEEEEEGRKLWLAASQISSSCAVERWSCGCVQPLAGQSERGIHA